jgi:lysophospholipase L1-like esterase
MPRSSEPAACGAGRGRARAGPRVTFGRVAGWLLGLGLAAAAAVGGVELLLRLHPGLMPEEAQLRVHLQALSEQNPSLGHPELGFVYPPHFHGELRHGDFGFSYATDEHGFRNSSPWPAQADVVVLGDSQAFGYGVEAARSWWGLVAAGLPGSAIVNLGLIGAAPQQYARVFDAFGEELRPKVVLMALFPAYALTAVGQFDAWLAAGRPGSYDDWRSGTGLAGWQRSVKRLLERAYLWHAVRTQVREWRTDEPSRTLAFADGSALKLAPAFYRQAALHARAGDPAFERVLAIIEEVRARAGQTGAELLVVLIPTKEEVYLPLLGAEAAPFTARLAEALAARGIPRLDTTPRFRARAERGERLFFPLDLHPNPDGQQLIADLVLEYLRRQTDLGVPPES